MEMTSEQPAGRYLMTTYLRFEGRCIGQVLGRSDSLEEMVEFAGNIDALSYSGDDVPTQTGCMWLDTTEGRGLAFKDLAVGAKWKVDE